MECIYLHYDCHWNCQWGHSARYSDVNEVSMNGKALPTHGDLLQNSESKLLDASIVKLLYAHQEATETTK